MKTREEVLEEREALIEAVIYGPTPELRRFALVAFIKHIETAALGVVEDWRKKMAEQSVAESAAQC